MKESLRVRASRYGAWLLIAVLALAAAAWAFWPRPLPFDVATVIQGRFEQPILEPGLPRVRNRCLLPPPTGTELA